MAKPAQRLGHAAFYSHRPSCREHAEHAKCRTELRLAPDIRLPPNVWFSLSKQTQLASAYEFGVGRPSTGMGHLPSNGPPAGL